MKHFKKHKQFLRGVRESFDKDKNNNSPEFYIKAAAARKNFPA